MSKGTEDQNKPLDPATKVAITVGQLNAVLMYLETRPYREVSDLVKVVTQVSIIEPAGEPEGASPKDVKPEGTAKGK